MLHLDYTMDVYPGTLILDKEFPNHTLNVEDGDIFRVKIKDGQIIFSRVDRLEAFVRSKDPNHK